jgi:hypothetical protein
MDNPDTPVILDTRQRMKTNRTKTQYRKLKRMNITKNPVGNQDVRVLFTLFVQYNNEYIQIDESNRFNFRTYCLTM